MHYHVVDPADLDPVPDRPCDLRRVGAAVGFENLGLNVYEAEPGEQLPLAYHVHEEQEEAFVVLEGTLSVETPEGTFRVDAGEVFAAHPESPHRAYNPEDAAGSVRAVVIGAPKVDDVSAYEGGE